MKKIILVGPTCSGKTHLRERLERRGFKFNINYTSREKRPGEIDGVHYNFLSKNELTKRIVKGKLYEWTTYNDNLYGTGLNEWKTLDGFILETEGIKNISPEDRKECFIIYVCPPTNVRVKRMKEDRDWDPETIQKRLETDNEKFKDFTDYDMLLRDPYF
jgi:guanylate kinase